MEQGRRSSPGPHTLSGIFPQGMRAMVMPGQQQHHQGAAGQLKRPQRALPTPGDAKRRATTPLPMNNTPYDRPARSNTALAHKQSQGAETPAQVLPPTKTEAPHCNFASAAHAATLAPSGPALPLPCSKTIDVPTATVPGQAAASARGPGLLGAFAPPGTAAGSNDMAQQLWQQFAQHVSGNLDFLYQQGKLHELMQTVAAAAPTSSKAGAPFAIAIQPQYSIDEVNQVVHQVLEEYSAQNAPLVFDFTDFAKHILNRESVNVTGFPQCGKSLAIATVALVAAVAKVPHVVIECDAIATAEALETNLNGHFANFNKLRRLSAANIKLQAVHAGTTQVVKENMKPGDLFSRVQSGQTTLVMAFTAQQIERIRQEVVEVMRLPILLTLDEADMMFSSVPITNDDPDQARLLMRERAFYRLVRCLKSTVDDQVKDADSINQGSLETNSADEGAGAEPSSLARRFPALIGLVPVSATPVDTLRWHMGKELSMRHLAPTNLGDDYCGPDNFKPFEDHQGRPVFLGPRDVTKATNYGLDLPKRTLKAKKKTQAASAAAESSAGSSPSEQVSQPVKSLIRQMYDSVVAAAEEGQQGQLILDITVPGVKVEASAINRAKQLAAMYTGFEYLVVTGEGVQAISPVIDSSGNITAEPKVAAVFSKRTCKSLEQAATTKEESDADGGREGAEEDEPEVEVYGKLACVLRRYDKCLGTPVVVLGYFMIRRSLSIRTDARVPTHIICAPSNGTTMANFQQMVGRGMGYVRSVLDLHGFKCVRVLCFESDYRTMQRYYELTKFLNSKRADGTRRSLIQTIEDVPAEFHSDLCGKRRQGQKALNSGKFLDRLNEYEQVEGAAASPRIVKFGEDGRLGGGLHRLMMQLGGSIKQLGRPYVTYADVRKNWPQDLLHYAMEIGHQGPFLALRQAEPPLLAHCINEHGNIRPGVHELTKAGRKYVRQFAGDLPDAGM